MIGPSQAELDIREQIKQAGIADTDPLTYYQRLIEELRTGQRVEPNKDEFRDVFEYGVLLAAYANLLLERIGRLNDQLDYAIGELRKVNPEAARPRLNLDSVITIDGTQISLAELAELIKPFLTS